MRTKCGLMMFFLLCSTCIFAQFRYQGSDGYIRIGEEKYTPMIIQEKWGIEYWEDGLNFWIPWPNTNSGNYKLFLKNDGNVGIGKKPSYKLDVAGDIATSGSFITTSDKRLKTNIKDLDNSLDKLLLINGKSYNKRIIAPNNPSTRNYKKLSTVKQKTIENDTHQKEVKGEIEFGFIAQEIIDIFPELVTQDGSGYYSIDYIGFIPVIIEAIKEQKANIDKQESEIQKLDSLIKTINNTQIKIDNNLQCSLSVSDTEIKYQINKTYASAQITVYDQNGVSLNTYKLPGNTLNGSIYYSKNYRSNQILIYNLVGDGNILVSKKVIN